MSRPSLVAVSILSISNDSYNDTGASLGLQRGSTFLGNNAL